MNFPGVLDAFSFLDRHCIFKTRESNWLRSQYKNAQFWEGLRWITTPSTQHGNDVGMRIPQSVQTSLDDVE